MSDGRLLLRHMSAAIFLIFLASPARSTVVFAQTLENPENPFIPKRSQVTFSGSGSADFVPRNLDHSMPGPPQEPNCLRKITPVGFQIQCVVDPEVKSAPTCKGTLSFYAFNETRNVVGDITQLPTGSYTLKLRSNDDDIQGCQLSNLPPVSSDTGNVVVMQGCTLKAQDCAGEVTGSGGNRALTSSASILVTPAD